MATELLLTGLLPSSLHASLLETLAQLCELGEAFSQHETVFKRSTSAGPNDVRIRARRLKLKSDELRSQLGDFTRLSVTVLHKPEPVRISPSALQYSVSEIAIERGGATPEQLISSFGFAEKEFELRKRGSRWEKSGVLLEVYQLYESEDATEPLDSESHIVQASVRFSQAITSSTSAASANRSATPNSGQQEAGGRKENNRGGNSGQEDREKALSALEAVKKSLKGLVDLKRIET